MSDIIRQESAHSIAGVPGRMFTLHRPPAPWKAGTFANQKWVSESRPVEGYGEGARLTVEMRFDDQCKNGHNDFAITGEIRRPRRGFEAGGCVHDEIAQAFPELAHLIRWHLTSTDGPMHYVANTCYLAGDRDCYGRAQGEPSSWESRIYFGTSPVSHPIGDKFAAFIRERAGTGDFHVVAIDGGTSTSGYKFSPKFTFLGFGERWHDCPFDTHRDAQEWADAVNAGAWKIERVPTAFSEGKPRELDNARKVAVWPDATDEQLSAPRANLEAALLARLPALLAAFRADIESCGFMWSCPLADESTNN